MPAMPPYPDALAFFPGNHPRTDCIDHSRHLMARNAWIVESWPMAFFDEHVTMANPTGLDFHADGIGLGFRQRPVGDLEGASWGGDLHGCHDCHQSLLRWQNIEKFTGGTRTDLLPMA
jgi:hypothetical protein